MKNQFRLTCSALILGVTLTSANLLSQIKPVKPPVTDVTKVIKTKTNINTASAAGIALLPGLDGETARKIVAGRPYKSLSDLEKVVPGDVLAGIKPLIVFDSDADANVREATDGSRRSRSEDGKLDINTANAAGIALLPGLDGETARKIVDGRPYKSVSDLKKVVPGDVLRKIAPFVKVTSDSDADSQVTADGAGRGLTPDGKLDINKASLVALSDLPGIDGDMAKRIVAARPYKSLSDLEKVVPGDVLRQIAPMIEIDARVNINQADVNGIAQLPGLDGETARKIVAGRPYKSLSDLEKVVAGDVLAGLEPLIVFDRDTDAGQTIDGVGRGLPQDGKLDINTADVNGIALLPGLDGETARKIVDGRPYKSVSDLKKVVPGDVLRQIAPFVKVTSDSDADSQVTASEAGRGLTPDGKLDINKASLVALSDLPGIDGDMAKRIAAARPYKSLSDLKKVVPGDLLRQIAPMIEIDAKVNINTADVNGIALLPGLDGETARKIVAGRPYRSLSDLEKVVPGDVLAGLEPLIVFDRDTDAGQTSDVGRGLSGDIVVRRVDVNTAEAAGLAQLPGLDGTTARQIIAGRPYKTVEDLAKVVPADVLQGLKPLICIDGRPVWSGPPIDANFTADGTLLIELRAPTSGFELRLDDIMVSDGVVTVQCTMTTPGPEESTNDLPVTLPLRVKRSRLANEASQVAVAVATVQRGAHYFVAPAYVVVANLSMAEDK